jgi:hypothetical protein
MTSNSTRAARRALPLGATLVAVLALTVLSFSAAEGASPVGDGPRALIMLAAGVKIDLVGMRFMELQHAPRTLRLLFRAWIVVVCTGILVLLHR